MSSSSRNCGAVAIDVGGIPGSEFQPSSSTSSNGMTSFECGSISRWIGWFGETFSNIVMTIAAGTMCHWYMWPSQMPNTVTETLAAWRA